jgi:hypothetical protein
MAKRYRVYFARRTYLELAIDVEADSEDEARMKAAKATEDGGDALVDFAETYSSSTESTGQIEEIEDEEIEDEEA